MRDDVQLVVHLGSELAFADPIAGVVKEGVRVPLMVYCVINPQLLPRSVIAPLTRYGIALLIHGPAAENNMVMRVTTLLDRRRKLVSISDEVWLLSLAADVSVSSSFSSFSTPPRLPHFSLLLCGGAAASLLGVIPVLPPPTFLPFPHLPIPVLSPHFLSTSHHVIARAWHLVVYLRGDAAADARRQVSTLHRRTETELQSGPSHAALALREEAIAADVAAGRTGAVQAVPFADSAVATREVKDGVVVTVPLRDCKRVVRSSSGRLLREVEHDMQAAAELWQKQKSAAISQGKRVNTLASVVELAVSRKLAVIVEQKVSVCVRVCGTVCPTA